MKHLKLFQTQAEYDEFNRGEIDRPNVSYIKNLGVIYNPIIPPLYIEAIEDSTVSFSNAIEYSLDNSIWETLPANTATPSIASGRKVFFRATGLTPTQNNGIGKFSTTAKCKVGGNIMSMAYGEEYQGKVVIETKYQFEYLFENAKNIIDATELYFPATTLQYYCYGGMFYNCTGLISAPKQIPVANVSSFSVGIRKNGSYMTYSHGMFENCTALINAPKLPATTLAESCYQNMFSGCTSLVNAPELPATMLQNCEACYQNMFSGCTSLANVPDLPNATFNNSSGSGSAYQNMFKGCTSLEIAPVLHNTKIPYQGYQGMFAGCSNLKYIKMMATDSWFTSSGLTDEHFTGWVTGVSPTGTFVKNSATTWETRGVNGIPEGWTIETAEA
jgi:hypothetical protein